MFQFFFFGGPFSFELDMFDCTMNNRGLRIDPWEITCLNFFGGPLSFELDKFDCTMNNRGLRIDPWEIPCFNVL